MYIEISQRTISIIVLFVSNLLIIEYIVTNIYILEFLCTLEIHFGQKINAHGSNVYSSRIPLQSNTMIVFWIHCHHHFLPIGSSSNVSHFSFQELEFTLNQMKTVWQFKKSSKSVGSLFNQFNAFWALSCILFNIFAQTLICYY